MLKSSLSHLLKIGAFKPMNSDEFSDQPNHPVEGFAKAPVLLELGRVVRKAYEQGVTLDEAYAICGAAYGDWRETHETPAKGSLRIERVQVQK